MSTPWEIPGSVSCPCGEPWGSKGGLRLAAEPEPAKPMNFKIKELTEEDWAEEISEKDGEISENGGTSKWMVSMVYSGKSYEK